MAAIPSVELETHPDELPEAPPQKQSALTPPTSEDMDKREDASSELSELDMDMGKDEDEADDDIGDIEPGYYYEDGRIPVFTPTMDQFKDFKKFVDKINKYGMKSGIVKVVPPKEWHDSLPTLEEAIKNIKVKNPIMQEFVGTHGTYTQQNIEKQRSYNLPQWRALTDESNHQPPAKRGERRRNMDQPKPKPARSQAATPLPDGQKRRPGRPRKRPLPKSDDLEATEAQDISEEVAEAAGKETQVPPTPTSPEDRDMDVDKEVKEEDEVEEEEKKSEETPIKVRKPGRPRKSSPKPKGRQPKATTVAERRKYNQTSADYEIDEEAFKDFDYHFPQAREFTGERCRELEEVYWKTLNYGTPMYGADMPGSLFGDSDSTNSWHVGHLENLLDVLGTKVPGVNTTYLYLGMWKATFAWHLEDVDLYSINYIHFGAPKQWYSISQEDARRFEAAMKSIWPTDAKHCDQFLRHKTYLISPEKLKSQFNIKVNKLVHNEGEFVITFPYGYHSGFNLGYNCAESVNFATESWLDYGRIAKKCNCEADSVWVDVAEIERKLRGEPTPEYYEETDDEDDDMMDRLPSPPASVAGKKKPGRKRKRDVEVKEPGRKKTKRIKILVKSANKMPCVLCPNDVVFDKLLPTDNGLKAHRLCALYTPETYITETNGQEIVRNVPKIDKSRLDLKCIFCRSKRGACFQCAEKKCTRAYHATCATAAGVLVDAGHVPIWDKEGTEFYCEGFDFRCRFHRPRRPKTADVEYLEKLKLPRELGKGLKKNDTVQAQYFGADPFGGVVVENRPEEQAVLLEVLPYGEKVEIEWKYILALDPAESKRPKPSPDAKLLPEDLHHDTDVNADNRKDGVPDVGDIFHSNEEQKWAEWNAATTREVRNPFQKKIEFSKPERIWYYLGRTSTEAKAQYTHDPDKTVHNPKSNFLDTVKPPPKPTVIPDRRSFPASYPSGVNFHALNGAMAAQRQQLQPSKSKQPIQMDRPYMYKPKQAISSILNPQSPVTPQAPQYGSDASKPGSNPTKFQAYSPPMQTAPSTAPPTFTQPVFTVPKAYQQPPNPSTTAKDPLRAGWPYQSATYTQVHGRSSPRADARSPHAPPTKPRTPSFSNGLQRPSSQSGQAPVANMLARPSSSAASPPSNSHSARPSLDRSTLSHEKQPWVEMSKAEYLERIKHIPYLLNAHLRRPPYYRSPYTYTGFSPEWLPRSSGSQSNSTIGYSASPYSSAYTLPPAPSAITAPTAPVAPMAPMGSASQNYMQSRSLPATIPGPYSQALQQQSKPQAQYSTPQQFQQQVNQETPGSGYNGQLRNLERMLQQLGDYKRTPGVNGTHASPNSPSSGAGAALGQDAISSLSYGTPNDRVGTPMKNTSSGGSFLNGHASWRTGSPMRPEYSPLSDVGQESSRPTTRDNMPSLQSLESWRT